MASKEEHLSQEGRLFLKRNFETGDRPTQSQFAELIDSFINSKDDEITIDLTSKNVGIGLQNKPDAKLEVGGDIKSSGDITVGQDLLVVRNMEVRGNMTVSEVELHKGNVQLGDDDNDEVAVHGYLQGKTLTTPLKIKSPLNLSKGLSIEKDTTIKGDLFLTGTGKVSTSQVKALKGQDLKLNNFKDQGILIKNDGNIGFGTDQPTTPISIRKPGALTDVGITQNQLGGLHTMELTTADEDGNQATRLLFRGNVGSNIEFYSGARGSEALNLIIKDNGNVGIGVWTPTQKLEVAGTIKADYFEGIGTKLTNLNASYITEGEISADRLTSDTLQDVLAETIEVSEIKASGHDGLKLNNQASKGIFINDDGNVGIGIENPTQSLDIQGQIVIGGPDLILGTHDGRKQGNKLGNRAMAHTDSGIGEDNLVINYNGDFEGGVQISGPKTIIDGKVGIGTNTPNGPLDIKDTTSSHLKIGHTDPGYAHHITSYRDLVLNSKNGFYFRHNPTAGELLQYNDLMRITENGNVGIGVQNPTNKLEVLGVVKAELFEGDGSTLTNINASNISGGTLQDVLPETIEASEIKASGTDGLKLNNKDSNGIFINDIGNVGIGTAEPGRDLSVNGIIKISRPGEEDRWTTDNWSKGIELENGNCIQFLKGGRGNSVGIGGNLGMMYFGRSSADDNSAAMIHSMVIDSDGNVGIGLTAPNTKLDVNGFVTAKGFYLPGGVDLASTVENFWKQDKLGINYDDGNVGIGLNNPGAAKLHINGGSKTSEFHPVIGALEISNSGRDTAILQANGITAPYRIAVQDGLGRVSHLWNAYTAESQPYKYDVSNEGATWLRIHGGTVQFNTAERGEQDQQIEFNLGFNQNEKGNVGIGKVGPKTKLDVAGFVTAEGYKLADGSDLSTGGGVWGKDNANIYYAEGKVGIGTKTPSGTLDIKDTTSSHLKIGHTDPGYAHHITSYRDLCLNSKNGFYFRNNPTAGDLLQYNDLMRIAENGNVGIGTTNPLAKLTVNGSLIRKVFVATGRGNDATNNGQILTRVLTFVKHYKDTAIRILYSDNLRIHKATGYCSARWEIRVDGAAPPGGAIYQDKHNNTGGYTNFHEPASVLGYAKGLPAGKHKIGIWVGPVPGRTDTADCYTGWNQSTWAIEAEEVWIQ